MNIYIATIECITFLDEVFNVCFTMILLLLLFFNLNAALFIHMMRGYIMLFGQQQFV